VAERRTVSRPRQSPAQEACRTGRLRPVVREEAVVQDESCPRPLLMVPADSSQADNPTAGEQLRREAADWLTAGRPPAGPMVGQRSLASGRRAFGQRVVEAEYLLAARERRASLVGIQAEAVAKASRCRGQKGGWPAVHRRKQQRRRVDLAEPASAEMRERRVMPANYCSPGPMAAEELAESPDWQASRPADARSPDKDRSLPAWGFLGHTNGNGSWANHDQETNHDQENCALQSSRLFAGSSSGVCCSSAAQGAFSSGPDWARGRLPACYQTGLVNPSILQHPGFGQQPAEIFYFPEFT